jgi:large subunit ribosomal protein L23
MKDLYQVLIRPIITEKSTIQKEAANQVTFEVHPNANKVEIRQAVERLLKKKVTKIRTIKVAGKVKRLGRNEGKRRNWKKAIVTLKPGEYIEFFEGV